MPIETRDVILPKRQYLAWFTPGHDEPDGRVELLAASTLSAPDGHLNRTAETVTIPSGSVIRLMVEDDPPEVVP
jgi:hypothetical protein